jgi:hypothetical protein
VIITKTVSICTSKVDDYIVYRYGSIGAIELEFPNDKVNSWNMFTFSSYLRGGGKDNDGLDLNYLSFDNKGFHYTIFDEYSSQDNQYETGVTVTDLTTNVETDLRGLASTRQGSLQLLRDSKVPKEDE